MRKSIILLGSMAAALVVMISLPTSVQPADQGSAAMIIYPAHQGAAQVPAIPAQTSTVEPARLPVAAPKPPAATRVPPATHKPPAASSAPVVPKSALVADWQGTFATWSARLPGTWVIMDKGSWGATSLETGTVYVAPRTPVRYLAAVMKHESMHVLQGRVYGGFYAAQSGLAAFGGMEVNADCGALIMGANWTGYTRKCTTAQNEAARKIMNGVRP